MKAYKYARDPETSDWVIVTLEVADTGHDFRRPLPKGADARMATQRCQSAVVVQCQRYSPHIKDTINEVVPQAISCFLDGTKYVPGQAVHFPEGTDCQISLERLCAEFQTQTSSNRVQSRDGRLVLEYLPTVDINGNVSVTHRVYTQVDPENEPKFALQKISPSFQKQDS